tara:strand:- start:407 stop:787 length:381 start_codon:yes stop_codon:yes gene_type:complete
MRRLVRELASGLITNDQFELGFATAAARIEVGSPDEEVLWRVYDFCWMFYDDLHEHRLRGRHALTAEARRAFARCVLLLGTDRPASLMSGSNSGHRQSHWPFADEDAYRDALRRPPYLAGSRAEIA